MIENHMVLNGPDAPWNAPDQPRWECDCGLDHAPLVGLAGYPKWHASGKFVDDCAAKDCPNRCCHDCAATCRICGNHLCRTHAKGFHRELGLCEDCGAQYAVIGKDANVEKLIVLEREIAQARAYGRTYTPTAAELGWLISNLKDAWEAQ